MEEFDRGLAAGLRDNRQSATRMILERNEKRNIKKYQKIH